jgi:hypothetical protein
MSQSLPSDDPLKRGPIGRILESCDPLLQDLERASQIGSNKCPRRYCWWWKSLGFEWELEAIEGCTWMDSPKPSHWRFTEFPCKRCDPSSVIDHFEPREPHIQSDGVDASDWIAAAQENREQYPG